jgi:hypothetical protein
MGRIRGVAAELLRACRPRVAKKQDADQVIRVLCGAAANSNLGCGDRGLDTFKVERNPRPREEMLAPIAFEPVDVAVARHAAEPYEPLALTSRAYFRFVVTEVELVRHDDIPPEQLMYLPETARQCILSLG